MTKGAALHEFFNRFEIPFYAVGTVPDDAPAFYGTYTLVFDAWGGSPVSLTVNLWYRTENEATLNAKVQELSAALGLGGAVLPCDGGFIWLRRGSPFAQAPVNAEDPAIKLRYINITAEYLTKD